MLPSFVTHLRCPLCTWCTAASSRSFQDAQRVVAEQLLRHVETAHRTGREPANHAPEAATEQPEALAAR